MINTLKTEGADDIEKRDQCKAEYQSIESTVKNVTWLIQKNVAEIDRLEKLIELRKEQKSKTEEEIAHVNATMRDLTSVRKDENTAFLAAKQVDQDAIDLLL